jgi:hypothetical protein
MLTLALNHWEKGKHLKHPTIRILSWTGVRAVLRGLMHQGDSVRQNAGGTVLGAEPGRLPLEPEFERKHPRERLRAQRTVLPVDV